MMLAVAEIKLPVLLLFLVFAFISWLSGKLNPANKKTPPGAPQPQPGPRRAPADSEEERMRRFMEALGIPQDSSPPPPARPKAAIPPVPPIVARPPVPAWPQPRRPRAAPAPPLPSAPSRRPPVQEPAPALPVAQIELPALAVPAVAEFETVTSTIAAIPGEKPALLQPLPAGATLSAVIRQALATPQQLRSALVLREILGPPLGLQS